ncbi:MAG: ATP-binding cassette domain-containing protein, partial [Spirochaetales bacterium]|nr:ATP-binding cassette domain-containing protein [Spirochaetales bacterium]
ERRRSDQQLLEDSFVSISEILLGDKGAAKFLQSRLIARNSLDEILKYYHLRPVELPQTITEGSDQLDYCLRPHGIMRRSVRLEGKWYKDAFGPILAFTKESGSVVALLPGAVRGYYFDDPETGKRTKVTGRNAGLFAEDALCFYKPLPARKLKIRDLLSYMRNSLGLTDILAVVAATVIMTLVSLMIPRLIKQISGFVVETGSTMALSGFALSLVFIFISSQLIKCIRNLIAKRIELKTSVGVQASMMMRLLSLPASFFRKYSPGELKSRSNSVNQLCSILLNLVLGSGLGAASALLYFTQIFSFARPLTIATVVVVLISLAFTFVSSLMQTSVNRRKYELQAKESGMAYSVITGVQKAKLTGSEKRLFARWLKMYSQSMELTYNPPWFLKLNSVIGKAITLISTIVIYFIAVKNRISPSSYLAFSAAYGAIIGSFSALSGNAAFATAKIRPILEMARPFLETEPETEEGKEIVTGISGAVEVSHVSFRYSDETPNVLDDFSMSVNKGEYVAIVGKTGCGKSTLMRLLLGFEKPDKGSVFYDKKDINSLDLGSLRRKIGTVMQNSELFQGDIYSNIVICAPHLSVDDAWEAAEKAGIADDIRSMPMGMQTFISEGGGGISGGQKQRLMIARAIAPKPSLLLFDEATSALDNRTQKQVSDSLDGMGCTRIVIAHRLSTIRHCDRILVLDGGRIAEEGTYDELVKKNGIFTDLVRRQMLEEEI